MARIRAALKPGGNLVIANGNVRSVPTAEKGCVNHPPQLKTMLAAKFEPAADGQLAREQTTEIIAQGTFGARAAGPAEQFPLRKKEGG